MVDPFPVFDVILPTALQPNISFVPGCRNAAQFCMLKDGKTGILDLGSFSDSRLSPFLTSLSKGPRPYPLAIDMIGAFLVNVGYWRLLLELFDGTGGRIDVIYGRTIQVVFLSA